MEITNSMTSLMIHMPVMILASDFDFDYDELADNLDELELSDEDLDVYVEEPNSMNESYTTHSDLFQSLSKS